MVSSVEERAAAGPGWRFYLDGDAVSHERLIGADSIAVPRLVCSPKSHDWTECFGSPAAENLVNRTGESEGD